MRIHRRLPAVFVRHLRSPDARTAHINTRTILPSFRRIDCGPSRRLLSTSGSPVRPASIPHAQPTHAASTEAGAARQPAMVMLQMLAQWDKSASSSPRLPQDSQEGDAQLEQLIVSERNGQFRTALKCSDFHHAQQILQGILEKPGGRSSSHPVDTENYDLLLYQWSHQCVARSKQQQQHKQIDLTPMMALLEQLIQWKRVSARTFNTAIVACYRLDALDNGLRVLTMMKQSGRQPKAFAYTNLISCCARLAGKHPTHRRQFIETAEKLFEELVASDQANNNGTTTTATIEAVNAMVFAYRSGRGYSQKATQLADHGIHGWSLQPDESTVATLVVCLLKDGNAHEASRWLQFALKHRIHVDDVMIQSVVDACYREKQWDKVDTLRRALEARGVTQKDQALQQIFKQSRFRQPHHHHDSSSSSAVLATMGSTLPPMGTQSVKQRKQEAATLIKCAITSLIKEEEGDDTVLSKAQWQTMFQYGKMDDLDQLMALLATTKNKNKLLDDESTAMTWINQQYLRAMGRAHQWWRVVETLNKMLVETPHDVDISCVNAAIRACTHSKRLDDAIRIMELVDHRKYAKLHLKPTRETYDALMQCCGVVGAVDASLRFFRELQRCGNFTPTLHDVNAVLKAYATSVQRLIQAGYDGLDTGTGPGGHGISSRSSSSEDEEDEYEDGFDVPASDLSQLALQALRFYQDVAEKKNKTSWKPNEAALFYLFRSFLGAAEVIDEMDFRAFEEFAKFETQDHAHYDDMEDMEEDGSLASRAEWLQLCRAVQKICRESPQESLSPRVFNVGIDFFQRRGEPDSAFELFTTMVTRQIPLTVDTIRLLFTACCHTGQDPQLGMLFLDHLLSEMKSKRSASTLAQDEEIRIAVATESLRWAAHMDNNIHSQSQSFSDEPSSSSGHSLSSELVDQVFETLVDCGLLQVPLSAAAYTQIASVYAQEGNITQTRRLAQRMQVENGSHVSLDVAQCILQACSIARHPLAALDTLAWIKRQKGLHVTVAMYNNVLSAIQRQLSSTHYKKQEEEEEEEEEPEREEEGQEGEDQEDEEEEEQRQIHRRRRRRKLNRQRDLELNLNGILDQLATEMDLSPSVHANAQTYSFLVSIASQRGEMARVLELFDRITLASQDRGIQACELLQDTTLLQYVEAIRALATSADTTTTKVELKKRIHVLRDLLTQWHQHHGYRVSHTLVVRLVHAYDAVDDWQNALSLFKNAKTKFHIAPSASLLKAVLESCNRAEQWKLSEQIFHHHTTRVAGSGSGGGSVVVRPTAACFVEMILALEEQAKWVNATQKFMEMNKKFAPEKLHPALLNKIAIGRYSEGRKRPN